MSPVAVRRALISVSDRTGLAEFARRLHGAGVEIVSSGGTARHLADHGVPVTPVVEVTGAPELLEGRVKTLHPRIHAGILADLSREAHWEDLEAYGVTPFQLVVVNLYPFEETVAAEPPDQEAIEQIDIGGPTLIRAAAKNHRWVGVVVSPERYDEVAAAIERGGLSDALRRDLAREAFFRTAAYDATIVAWLERGDVLPRHVVLPLERVRELRYGENPHQDGALYAPPRRAGWWRRAEQLQGKEMSFNNFVDAEAAWRLVHDLGAAGAAAVVVVKHTNPSGAAVAGDPGTAFERAWACDPLSAFGSVVAFDRPLDAAAAASFADRFVEVVVAPDVEDEAREVLARKRNLRLLVAPPPHGRDVDARRVEDGLLLQVRDRMVPPSGPVPDRWQAVTRRAPSDEELTDLRFAWVVAARTKSNAVVLARDLATVGVGAGDQSRVGATQRALRGAGPRAEGAVAASDAFLPFRDTVDALAAAGVTALVQPGGSRRDEEVVAAADEHGMAVVFTGRRHFLH